jgi:hypothetical protein
MYEHKHKYVHFSRLIELQEISEKVPAFLLTLIYIAHFYAKTRDYSEVGMFLAKFAMAFFSSRRVLGSAL